MKVNFIKEDIQMVNKHEKLLKIFILMRMQIELRYYFTTTRRAIIKKMDNIKCWQECEKQELSQIDGVNEKMAQLPCKTVWQFLIKLHIGLPWWRSG